MFTHRIATRAAFLPHPAQSFRAYHLYNRSQTVQSASNLIRPGSSAHTVSSNFRALRSRPFSTSISVMSTTGPGKYEYLVHIPDHPNALEKRLEIRPIHLKNLKPHIDAGKVLMGGALLGKPPGEGEKPDMKGSVVLLRADSEEDALEFLRSDPYTKGGAWDVDNAIVYPFRCAVRTAMETR